MRYGWSVAITALALVAGGCKRQAVECSAASAGAPVIDIVKDQLQRETERAARNDDSGAVVSTAKIRAAIAQLVIAIDDIRTSKVDPDSTKRFCTGTLKVRFPTDALADADRARTAVGLSSVSDLADKSDVERHADSFTTDIDFNVQPTDDGDKVFAETESGNNMFGFTAEVLASGLLKAAIEDGQRAQQQSADQQKATEQAALAEQAAANLNQAKTENQIAVQTIAATWKALSDESRANLLPLQRAWIRKKDADCAVEAASASVDPTAMQVARLACDTRVTQERISYLGQMRANEPVPAAFAPPTPASGGIDDPGDE